MKKILLLVNTLFLMLSLGCATKDYVRQQIDPLVDRISKIEAMDCCNKAEAAARRAEAAAERSENAAMKCGKAFELQQEK
ncbi:MAG: hypothetical protein A2Y97_13505 [Nitrospirae bacterium RBG_13_39_12]|nr:MAG: hypothetical protein A2Y97_13505 [Nitrospirae bacterium RBG_13_39_12]